VIVKCNYVKFNYHVIMHAGYHN